MKHRAGLEQFEVEGIDDDETFEVAAAASVQQARGNAMMIDDPVSSGGGAPVSKEDHPPHPRPCSGLMSKHDHHN